MADAKAHELVTADAVIETLGQDPELMGSATPAIEGAIARAKIKLQVMLDTKFAPLTCTDRFMVNGLIPALNRRYTLRLSTGLLRAAPVITWSTEVDGAYEAVINPITDLRRGIVQVPQFDDKAEWYIRVAYTSGYTAGDTVPTEITQGLLCLIPILILSTPAAQAETRKYWRGESAKAQSLETYAEDMVQEYTRRAGACARPIEHTQSPLQV